MSSLVNNKKFQPVLIVLVLGLWAFIGYKAMNAFSGEDELQSISIPLRKIKDKAKADKWKPSYAYADPFLKNKVVVDTQDLNEALMLVEKAKKIEVIVEKPRLSVSISFEGCIKNSKNSDRLGIFKMNDQTYLRTEGDSIQHIKIKKIGKDEVIIVEKGNEFTLFNKE